MSMRVAPTRNPSPERTAEVLSSSDSNRKTIWRPRALVLILVVEDVIDVVEDVLKLSAGQLRFFNTTFIAAFAFDPVNFMSGIMRLIKLNCSPSSIPRLLDSI
jgi:hypothetical protein